MPGSDTHPGDRPPVAQTVHEAFAIRLRQAREARGWTQEQLSDLVKEAGVPLERVTIARLEKGRRKASIGELVALAACLDVSPLYLLAPGRLETGVMITPRRTIESWQFLLWSRGDGPLDGRNGDVYNFMAPGSWVTWKPGDLESIKHGSGLSSEDAQDLVSDLLQQDRKKEAENDG